jgi:cell division protein FtsQ
MAKAQTSQSSEEVAVPFFRQRIFVIAVALLAMLIAASVAWMVWKWLPEWPVREVKFKGDFKQVDASELSKVANVIANVNTNARRSMLRTDLDEVQAAVKQVPWVRNANVRRQLPATLEITIEEHTPYGHWRDVSVNEAQQSQHAQRLMVNNFGEVFNTGSALKTADDKWLEMPVFAGPPGSGREVLAGFDQFRKQLLVVERTPKELQLSSRRAWLMKLDNGTVLELGRSDAIARLQRYIRAYHQLATLQAANSHIDLRYQNGLAVRTLVASKSK